MEQKTEGNQNQKFKNQQQNISSNNFGRMLSYPSGKRPTSNPQWAEVTQQVRNPFQSRPKSTHKVRAQELLALKKRVKQRHENKENNPMFRSDNWENRLGGCKNTNTAHTSNTKIPIDPLKLKLDDFEIGDLLGKGAQAKVRMAVHKLTRTIYSLKTIKKQSVEMKMDAFIRSLKIQMYLNHPNIAKVYGIIVEQGYVHIIMEYCIDGDLSMNVRMLKESKNLKDILFYTAQGLAYLHSMRVHHRDIKLQNVLLSSGVPKITDFQLSVYTKLDFFPRKTMCGSPAYFCPQMIKKQRYNKKADVWSLGIIFFELICGYFPFEVDMNLESQNIEYNKMKEFPPNVEDSAVNLILQMLCKESQDRVSINDVVNDPYFEIERRKSVQMRN